MKKSQNWSIFIDKIAVKFIVCNFSTIFSKQKLINFFHFLVQVMACDLFNAKPLSEPMVTNCWLDQ